MTCQWCKGELGRGAVQYTGKFYHYRCWEKVREMADRLGRRL